MPWQTITKENNLAVSIVQVRELNLATRIDAEHYQPHFIAVIDAVKKKNYKKLSEIVSKTITTGHTPSMSEESFYGGNVKFIKTDNLRDNQIVENFNHYLSDKGADKLKNALLKEDDIIVTIIGATYDVVGRVARIFPDLGQAAINQNISLIRPSIASGYLACFLMSKYGKQQLHYLSRQTEQVNLNNAEVSDVLIPIPSDGFANKIHATHNKTHNLDVRSKKLYEEAEQMLLEEINLKGYEDTDGTISIRNFSDCLANDRFDAEYWQPKYEKIIAKMPQKTLYQLGEISVVETGQYIKEYVEEALGNKPFIRGTNVSELEVDEDDLLYVRPSDQKNKHIAKKNDVVVARVGSIGLCARIQDNLVGATISDNLIAIRVNREINLNSFYLATYLNSFIGQELMNRFSRGSVQQRLNQETLKELLIPIVDTKIQEKIADKVIEAHSLKKEAKMLLEKAKRVVEIFIEKDEKSALEYLN